MSITNSNSAQASGKAQRPKGETTQFEHASGY